jgi:hypothetical protein
MSTETNAEQAGEQADQEREQLERQVRSGANWFFLIAGLSIVNSVLFLVGSERSFVAGLGITQIVDFIVSNLGLTGAAPQMLSLLINLPILGGFVLLGVLGRREKEWPFWIGMILYGLDTLIFLVAADWLSLLFHIVAVYYMFKGVRALRSLTDIRRARPAGFISS